MQAGAKKVVRWAATCAMVLAACAPAWLIMKYGVDVPYWDQWVIAPFFEKLAHGTLKLSDLFAQQSEYREFFPHLIFVALGWLTRWDVRYEMFVSLLLACLVAFNVGRLGARTEPDPFRRSVLFLLASLFIFSAIQFENWLFGVQVVYFMPAACVTTGLLVASSERVGTRAALLSCACLAAVSTFSSANGVLCWLLLPPVLLAARPDARQSARRWLPLWGAGLALCVALYGYGYYHPPGRPSTLEALRHPFKALAYFVAFLGSPLAVGPRPLAVAFVVGACALAAYAFACAHLFKFRADRALLSRAMPWVALGAYTLGTAMLVTIGRLGSGFNTSAAPGYTTFSLYLPVALVYLLPYVIEDKAHRRGRRAADANLGRLGAAAAVFLVLAHIAIFVLVVRHGAYDLRRARLHAKACLLFIEVVPDERCLAEELHPDVRLLGESAGALDRMGYLRPPLIRDVHMRGLTAPGGGVCSDEYGSFELSPAGEGLYVAAGGARLPGGDKPADVVVLAYGQGEDDQAAFALAEVGSGSGAGARDDARWQKTFPATALPDGPPVELTAWAFDAVEGKAYKLCGTHTARQRPE